MKTEQEQIKAIKQIIDERVETTLGQVQGRHGNVIKTVDTVIIARDIVNAGYGDVFEYKAEIEQLKAENEYRKKQYDNQVAENTLLHIEYDKSFERLKAQQREIDRLKANINQSQDQILGTAQKNQEYREQQVKQAKIDVLNRLKERYGFYSCCSWMCVVKSLTEIIDEFIKEIKTKYDDGSLLS